ncbi:metal ABC transporter permease [Halalkalicoccus subterraneus]|uniref:metal ABC transporter permease n=1 Tax=Halalkalicoccus subterraneus TaxID=2675002 RepID=UPI000EFB3EA1|nr:metal ABC transporter permease [Halalkalicoccus subterraneus]
MGSNTLQRFVLVAFGLAVLGLFVPIAFGLMPRVFFESSCSLGRSFGTSIACYGFIWNALTTAVFIGIVGPVIGTYLVHREMALIGETLAHAAFAGVAIGTLLFAGSGWGTPLLLSALVAGIVGALAVQFLAERTGSYGDVPIAIMLTGSFAVGTLVISLGGGFATVDINSILFGSIATVDGENVLLMAVLSIAVVGTVALTYKPLLYITFDEEAARVARFNVSAYNTLLIVLTAMVVVGSMQILGVILVAAMLVVPVAAGSQVTNSFRDSLYASVVVGELSAVSGLLLSWRYSLAPGATIVVVAIGIYLLSIALADRTNRTNAG